MKKEAYIFSAGSILYPIIEILWRGHTHYSMAIAGGLSLMFIDIVCLRKLRVLPTVLKAAVSSAIITTIELVTGVVFNIILKMNIWDYSSTPYNFLGQICLPFSIIWFMLAFPAMWLCRAIDNGLKKLRLIESRPAKELFPDFGQ